MNKKKLKKCLVLVLVLIECISMILTIKSFNNGHLEKIKEEYKVDNKKFSMYIQNDKGTYIPYDSSNLFPDGYNLNLENSSCVDINGHTVNNVLDSNSTNITITSNKTIFCYLYFDKQIDIKINVKTDGKENLVPNTLGYNKTITCKNGTTPTWDYKYNRLEINDLKSNNETCELTYTKQTESEYTNLRDKVLNDTVVTKSSTMAGKDDYISYTQFSSSSYSSTSGTATEVFKPIEENAGFYWSNMSSNMTSGTYYHLKFFVSKTGNYQLCYFISNGSSNNRFYFYKNSSRISIDGSNYISAIPSDNKMGCLKLGELTTNDYIKVTQRAYDANSDIDFYLSEIGDSGNRYVGKNPNNYVWFNNEMWRIIGSIPTCMSESCATSDNLVKLIRNQSIGSLVYDAKSSGYTGAWGSNTLYKLLNNYYYGALDGTETDYCYAYKNTNRSNCDYRRKGIKLNGYGSMVENVYWNTGYTYQNIITGRSGESFINELKNQTVSGYIGLMTPSDYGYAADSIYHNSMSLSSYYDSTEVLATNWLYGQGYEWTSTQHLRSTGTDANILSSDGNVSNTSSYYAWGIRPVIYLKPSVYIMSGTGTSSDPYIIGM